MNILSLILFLEWYIIVNTFMCNYTVLSSILTIVFDPLQIYVTEMSNINEELNRDNINNTTIAETAIDIDMTGDLDSIDDGDIANSGFAPFGTSAHNNTRGYTQYEGLRLRQQSVTFCYGCKHRHCIFCSMNPPSIPTVEKCNCGMSTCMFANPGLTRLRFPDLADEMEKLSIDKKNQDIKDLELKKEKERKATMVDGGNTTPFFWRCGCRAHIVARPEKGEKTIPVRNSDQQGPGGKLLKHPRPPSYNYNNNKDNRNRNSDLKFDKLENKIKKYRKIAKKAKKKHSKKRRQSKRRHRTSSSSSESSSSDTSNSSSSDDEDVKKHNRKRNQYSYRHPNYRGGRGGGSSGTKHDNSPKIDI